MHHDYLEMRGLGLFALVTADQFSFGKDVAFDGRLDVRDFCFRLQIRNVIKGIKLKKVMMQLAGIGTRAAIANFPGGISALTGAVGERGFLQGIFRKGSVERRDRIDEPVDRGSGGSRVGIVNDERETLRAGWRVGPDQGRRDVCAAAGVFHGDCAIGFKRRAGQLKFFLGLFGRGLLSLRRSLGASCLERRNCE